MIDQDEIRKEVAVKNNVWLGENDPMLQTVTIFEKALEQAVFTLNVQQEANLKTLLNAMQQHIAETKAAAGRVVTQGTEFACDQIQTAISTTMEEGREQIRKELLEARAEIAAAKKSATALASVSALCAVISVGAVAFVL